MGSASLTGVFHVVHYGETAGFVGEVSPSSMAEDFDAGVLIGLLIGEGHFGGDGRQPQVTLRMHVRHTALMEWLDRTFPGGRVYGPYNHGGRHYLQWMARGAFLRDQLLPIFDERLSVQLDEYSWNRFTKMCETYARQLRPSR